jgi:hypothetical protein
MVSIDRSDKTSTSEISSFDFVTEQRGLTHIYKQSNIICNLIPFNSLHTKLCPHITYPVSVKLYIMQLQQKAKLMKLIWWLGWSHCCPHITLPHCTNSIFNWFQSWNSILQISTISNIDLKFVSKIMLLCIRSTNSVTISWNYSQKLLTIIFKTYLSHFFMFTNLISSLLSQTKAFYS